MTTRSVTPIRPTPPSSDLPDGWHLVDGRLRSLAGPFPTLLEARTADDRLEAHRQAAGFMQLRNGRITRTEELAPVLPPDCQKMLRKLGGDLFDAHGALCCAKAKLDASAAVDDDESAAIARNVVGTVLQALQAASMVPDDILMAHRGAGAARDVRS